MDPFKEDKPDIEPGASPPVPLVGLRLDVGLLLAVTLYAWLDYSLKVL